jgi:hypothetical protein
MKIHPAFFPPLPNKIPRGVASRITEKPVKIFVVVNIRHNFQGLVFAAREGAANRAVLETAPFPFNIEKKPPVSVVHRFNFDIIPAKKFVQVGVLFVVDPPAKVNNIRGLIHILAVIVAVLYGYLVTRNGPVFLKKALLYRVDPQRGKPRVQGNAVKNIDKLREGKKRNRRITVGRRGRFLPGPVNFKVRLHAVKKKHRYQSAADKPVEFVKRSGPESGNPGAKFGKKAAALKITEQGVAFPPNREKTLP